MEKLSLFQSGGRSAMRLQSIIGSSIGNILEWYDFGLFEIFSPTLSQLFFPSSEPHAALILTFGLFAIGFLCRPLGALAFGYLGDKKGRVITLRLAILLISLPTLLIGLLPTYETIGVAAPLLLMIIRMWQGFCVGGECAGNVVYLAEISPFKHRAMTTSLAGMGANMGFLLALLIGVLCNEFFSEAAFKNGGWRLPYLVSGLLCLVIYIARLNMQETISHKSNNINPIKLTFKNNIPDMLRIIGLLCMGITFFYTCFVYMPSFLTQNFHYSTAQADHLMILITVMMLFLSPIAGMLCDRVGRRKLLLWVVLLMIVTVIPGFYFIAAYTTTTFIIAAAMIFTLISSLEQGVSFVAVAENYPLSARYTGLSLAYNTSTAFFGGITPLFCEWLIGKMHSLLAPAFYIIFCALITGGVAFFLMQEKCGESLV